MRALARWCALLLLAAPVGTWALGLGDIELRSALNQPLEADIRLVSATPEELEGLRVELAPRETFDRYGLERPAFLSSLEFRLARDPQGRDVIRVTSRQSVSEPFLTLLVEATWPRGRLLREYTLLLDPPVLLPPAAEPVAPASTPSSSQAPAGPIARPQEPPAAAAGSAPAAAEAPRASAPAPSAPAPRAAEPGGSYGPVQRAETLWSIASRLQPQGVTLNQMMVALYEANPQAFDGNMNLLLQGAVLRVPEMADLQRLGAQAANAEYQRHTTEWEAGRAEEPRLRLVAAGDDVQSPAAGASPAGGDPAALARLEEEVSTLRTQLEENRRLLQIRDEQLAELQAQLAAAEQAAEAAAATSVAAAPAAGVDLESEPLFADDALFADELPGAGAEFEAAVTDLDLAAAAEGAPAFEPVAPDAEAETAASEPEALAEAEPTPVAEAAPAPAAGPSMVVSTPESEGTLLSQALQWLAAPLLWIGLGAAALLGAALYFLRQRRAEEAYEDVTGEWDALDEEDVAVDAETRESTDRIRKAHTHKPPEDTIVVEEPPVEDPATVTKVVTAAAGAGATATAAGAAGEDEDTFSSQTALNLDQDDPLAEADFHMAYGLYDQAADLVLKALETDPSRRDLKVKLLEVYFVWGNKDAFLGAARDLREEIGEEPSADWDKVMIMGKQICPDEALFAGAASGAGAAVDMDLVSEGASGLDLEVGDRTGTDLGAGLDFAFDATGAGQEETAALDALDLGFDDQDGAQDFADVESTGTAEITARAALDDDLLDIGAQTAAGIEEALFFDDEDETGTRRGAHDGGLAATQESPTVETPWSDGAAHGEADDTALAETALAGLMDDGHEADAGADDETAAITYSFDEDEDEEAPSARFGDATDTPGLDSDPFAATGDGSDFEWPTMESPTVETAAADAPTMESPTVETAAADAPTLETPTVETASPDAPTMETPTVQTARSGDQPTSSAHHGTAELPTVEQPRPQAVTSSESGEHTAEIDLAELGLDMDDLHGLTGALEEAVDLGDDGDTREQFAVDDPDGRDLLSATGITEVLEVEDALPFDGDVPEIDEEPAAMRSSDAERRRGAAQGSEGGTLTGTEVLDELPEGDVSGETSLIRSLGSNGEVDLDLDELTAALDVGNTVEQPGPFSGGSDGIFGAGNGGTPIDLDLGFGAGEEGLARSADEALDPQTMSEVGTKLDLARAYIDMGDPDGAKSILEEVLDEGDAGQRQEAKSLIDSMIA